MSHSIDSLHNGRDRWDVVVIGAGPAGALAASELARDGRSVLLLDKSDWPRRKVCGGCLNPAALSVLDQVGLTHLKSVSNAPTINKLELHAYGTRAVLSAPMGVAIDRKQFDSELVASAQEKGATFCARANVREITFDTLQHQVKGVCDGNDFSIQADKLIVAAGLGTRLLKQLKLQVEIDRNPRIGLGAWQENAPAAVEPGTIYMNYSPSGYVGLVQLENGALDIAAAVTKSRMQHYENPSHLICSILREADDTQDLAIIDTARETQWKGTASLTQRSRRLGGPQFRLIGDAAGYIEPFTGEGMAWALMSGYLVAKHLRSIGNSDSKQMLRNWEATYRRHIGKRQKHCRWISNLLKKPRLATGAALTLRQFPRIAKPAFRSIHAPFQFEK